MEKNDAVLVLSSYHRFERIQIIMMSISRLNSKAIYLMNGMAGTEQKQKRSDVVLVHICGTLVCYCAWLLGEFDESAMVDSFLTRKAGISFIVLPKDPGSKLSVNMYNWLLENIALRVGDRLLGTSFIGELKNWRRISRCDHASVNALQTHNLRELLLFCSRHNSYYKRFLPTEETIRTANAVDILKSLPVLNKEIIRRNKQDLISIPFLHKKHHLIEEKSSGSSGIQGSVLMTRKESFQAIAAQTHLWEWSGYKLGDALLQLGITPERGMLKNVKDFFCRTTYKTAFNINAEDVTSTLQNFRYKKNAFFGGYASGLFTYAETAQKTNSGVHFQSVISWGDKMFPHYRKKIESAFNTTVYDTYGCTEGLMVAGQCEKGSYHILTPHLYLEILDENGNEVSPGTMGYVVATRLDCFSFPLVRYQLGDLAIRKDPAEACSCGRPYPLLFMIVGRDTDIVYTPTGKPLIVHFFTGVFEHEQHIKQFRVVQEEDWSLLIEYITDLQNDTALVQRITKKIHERCGELLPIRFRRVKFIPSSPSGKPQIIQSHHNKTLRK